MTTTIVFANTSDDYLFSSSSNYSTALAGSSLGNAGVGTTTLFTGQRLESSTYTIWQAFIEFGYTAATDAMVIGSYIRLESAAVTGTGVTRRLEIQNFDWGGTVDTGDWRNPSDLSLLNDNWVALILNAQDAGTKTMRAGHEFRDQLDSSSTIRYVINTNLNRLQNAPTGLEYNGFRSSDFSGTANDPALFVAEASHHLLNRSLGAQVQLSDGTFVLTRFQQPDLTDSINEFVHYDPITETATLIDTFTGQGVNRRGAQAYSMARDSDDNVYVVNQSSSDNNLNCRVFLKQPGHNWITGDLHQAPLPDNRGDINNVSITWHPQGGDRGTLVGIASHAPARNSGTPLSYVLISCDHLFAPHSSLDPTLRGSGDAENVLVQRTVNSGFNNYPNETGTLLDVSAAAIGSDRGWVMCAGRHQSLGGRSGPSIGRYILNPSGTGFTSTVTARETFSGFSVKDADAKARTLPVSASQFVTVNASDSDDFGIVVKHRQNIGEGRTINTLSEARLDAEGITSMPASTTVATSSAWDALFSPLDNTVWVYYFDAADDHRLMRTHVDLNTGEAARDEVEVNATVGATGSTNHAIRVHRHHTVGDRVLISVANEDSGGTHELLFVSDFLNVAPDQPTLAPKANFDSVSGSAASRTFEWTFNDANLQDTQSAFQLQIDNATTEASAHDSGKVVSLDENYTLPASGIDNDEDYIWRVKTWDSDDVEGPFSDFSGFSTSAAGIVNITTPAIDNDPDIIVSDVLIEWTVDNSGQDERRVLVTETLTNVVHEDTGFETTSLQEYIVEGLQSDVEYLVQVTTREAAVASNTAERLVNPSYAAPEIPILSVEPISDEGYILVSVENPEPNGDRPNVDSNEIWRRRTDLSEPFELIATIDPSSTYRDYTAASRIPYTYMARAGVERPEE